MPPPFDLLLRNAVIFDGTGGARHHGDIALSAGRIADVGRLEATDAAVAIDTTPANDLPPVIDQDVSPNTRLGHGPAIYVMTRRDLSDPRLVQHFMTTGDALKIPYQIRQPGGGGTNAGGIIPARSGVPTISVSVPARYLHSPASAGRSRLAIATTRSVVWPTSAALLIAAGSIASRAK
jgi:endoglucanase